MGSRYIVWQKFESYVDRVDPVSNGTLKSNFCSALYVSKLWIYQMILIKKDSFKNLSFYECAWLTWQSSAYSSSHSRYVSNDFIIWLPKISDKINPIAFMISYVSQFHCLRDHCRTAAK